MSQDQYAGRHVGSDERALSQMLSAIGVRSVDELIGQVVPSTIRLKKPLALPREGMSECEFAAHIREIGRKNKLYRSLIGMGYYGTASPAVILRNVFENPAWYTSYTPYQAEISQGRLEALLNFQTAVVSMTGMEVSNCSLLDEATATAEAMAMMFALRSREAVREGRNVLFVDENIFPQTLDVLLTRSEPFGIEIVSDRFDCYEFTGSEFGAIVQYPAADGEVRDYDDFAAAAHSRGVLVTAVADMLSLALLKAPGEWGADIVTGSTQRFGIPMGSAALMRPIWPRRTLSSEICPAGSSAFRSIGSATKRCAWRFRCASSTSSASGPRRISVRLRRCWLRWPASSPSITEPRASVGSPCMPTVMPSSWPIRSKNWVTS